MAATETVPPTATFATPIPTAPPRRFPALTTQYAFPSNCSSFWEVTSEVTDTDDEGSPLTFATSDSHHPDFMFCQPTEYRGGGGFQYSPGVCPESWTYWQVRTSALDAGYYSATCCAPGFSITTLDFEGTNWGGIWGSDIACVHSYSNTDDFLGDMPTSLPSDMSSGLQVHQPWTVAWHTDDTSTMPDFLTSVPISTRTQLLDWNTFGWWDPGSGETGSFVWTAEETGSSSNNGGSGGGGSGTSDDMQRFGFVLIGIAGVIALMFAVLSWWCCRGARVGDDGKTRNRWERWREKKLAQERAYEAVQAAIRRRDAELAEERSIRVYPSGPPEPQQQRGEEQQQQQQQQQWQSQSPPPMDVPSSPEPRRQDEWAERQPTPPPPYGTEDNERWETSADNPTPPYGTEDNERWETSADNPNRRRESSA